MPKESIELIIEHQIGGWLVTRHECQFDQEVDTELQEDTNNKQ
jgi:hypothetical protein